MLAHNQRLKFLDVFIVNMFLLNLHLIIIIFIF